MPSWYFAGVERRMGPGPNSIVAAGGSGSAFGDHGTTVTLSQASIANDTASSTTFSWASVRGTQARSGKYYFEVKVLFAPVPTDSFEIGLADSSTATGAAMNVEGTGLANCFMSYAANGNAQANSSTLGGPGGTFASAGTGWTPATNDVMGVAWDGVNMFSYLSINNAWFNSGDPTSGAAGTGHIASYASGYVSGSLSWYPCLALLGTGTFQLITTGVAHLPSGYSEWG